MIIIKLEYLNIFNKVERKEFIRRPRLQLLNTPPPPPEKTKTKNEVKIIVIRAAGF